MNQKYLVKNLSDLIEYETKRNIKKHIPYVGLEDIQSNSGTFLGSKEPKEVKSTTYSFSPDHILYGRLRPYLNKVFLPDFEGHCSTEIIPIKTKNNINKKFFYYWITSNSIVETINRTCTGARMPRANLDRILDLSFPLPPLTEQQRIVDILDQSFAAIDQAIENIYVNIKYVQESYSNYLKQTLKYPIQNWRHSTIGEVCEIRSGTTLDPKTEKPHGEFPYLKVADLNLPENLKIITTSSRFINKSDINLKNLIPKGSIVFPKRGGAIFTNKKRITAKEIWMDLNLMAVTPKDEIIPLFLYYFFQNLDFRSFNKGSSVPQLNNYDILPLIIFFPKDKYEQEKIVNKLELYENYSKNLELLYEKKISLLQELKQSILNKAFNGDLS
jgi:type I restriction enzyme S subunit